MEVDLEITNNSGKTINRIYVDLLQTAVLRCDMRSQDYTRVVGVGERRMRLGKGMQERIVLQVPVEMGLQRTLKTSLVSCSYAVRATTTLPVNAASNESVPIMFECTTNIFFTFE